MTYKIVEVDTNAPTQLEQLGTKTKFWYQDSNGEQMLFKRGRPGTGENWAEKVCCEICCLLGLPHAEYELASHDGTSGVVTPSFVPEGSRLILGNELLARIINDYDKNKRFKVKQYTIRRTMAVLSSPIIHLPLGWNIPPDITDSAGAFTGYLMLDALVSNQDRHHENWGVILDDNQILFFTPTFDHASSLGRNENDDRRILRLTTNDKNQTVAAYVARARSPFFYTPTSGKPLTTLDAFLESAKLKPRAADYWIGQLSRISLADIRAIIDAVPDAEMSEPARDFAFKMIEENTGRIINARTQ